MDTSSTNPRVQHIAPVRVAALVVGALFLLVGLAGFIPGITTHTDMLAWAGHHSGSLLLGVFAVSVLHNLVHLAFGVSGLVVARTAGGARLYLIAGGIVYLALTVYGLLVDHASTANFVPLNTADNWLHLGLGVVMVALGALLGQPAEHRGAIDGLD
ncbi:MAG: DUF4383 domain-containing protein [Mycolicibacterium cosmeticum]|nr:DUF4383 domain-containing protein [Mycolicibacterium cosmeticum]